ncbi:MAG: hypothetical protein ACRYF7_22935 [Janthinobacterium lividum]
MQHSDQPFLELERAKKAVEAMRESASVPEVEDQWKEFLHRIERVWTKSMNHFGKSPKWPSWHGKYVQLRRKDQLLSYLINARGADEHTVAEITEKKSPTLVFSIGAGGDTAFINELGFNADGTPVVDFVGDGEVEYTPGKVKALPVSNRGVKYEAPTIHLSRPIDPENLIDIAEQGLAFYADFLKAAEEFFVTSTPASSGKGQ